MKSSWAYTEGMQLATSDPEVVRALWQPIEAGWMATGSINVTGPSGEANLAIPLKGTEGQATLYVVAGKSAGRWTLELAEVDVDGRPERIDLTRERRE